MSKHSVRGGNVAGLLERFAQLQEKVGPRTGSPPFRSSSFQEAGLDGFWIHRVLQNEADREPRGRSSLGCNITSTPARED